jgi:hypothetical protein
LVEELDEELDLRIVTSHQPERREKERSQNETYVDELNCRATQLVGNDVEERFGTERLLIRTGLAPS